MVDLTEASETLLKTHLVGEAFQLCSDYAARMLDGDSSRLMEELILRPMGEILKNECQYRLGNLLHDSHSGVLLFKKVSLSE